jgi:prepilin-type N-terminal cleavage/methylation domain-containing protein
MNPIVPIFSKFLKNKSGFTLMELMMVTGMLALFTLAVTELIKGQKALIIESEIAGDMTQMKAEIQSLLSTPQHCNANFSKKALGDQPAIYTCSTSGEFDCIPLSDSPGSPVEKFKKKSGTDWTNTGSASNRVRIVSIITKFEALEVPSESEEALGAGIKTNASMTVIFEKKYLTTTKIEEFPLTKIEEVTFTTPVIDMGNTSRSFALIFRAPEKCSNSWNYLNMEELAQ